MDVRPYKHISQLACFALTTLSIMLLHSAGLTTGVCTWPTAFANSVWEDSSKRDLTFAVNTMSGWEFTVKSNTLQEWQCHSTSWLDSDSYLILRTTSTFSLFTSSVYYGYICMKLIKITDFSYRYYLYNPEQVELNGERVLINAGSTLADINLLCLASAITQRPAVSEYRVLISSGNGVSAQIACPYVFLGKYDYVHTASDGTVTCDTSTDTWDTCSNTRHVSFSYNTCSTKVAYSVSETVWCVDSVPVGDNNFVTVYNGNDDTASVDNIEVFKFSCFAISSDGTKASVSPNSCKKDQTSEDVPTDSLGQPSGSTLALTNIASCPLVTAPSGGSVSYMTDGALTTANYECDSAYSLAGQSSRACQSNLTWASVTPTCTCILPSAPANGSVVVSNDGTTITYSCSVGFVLVGNVTRTCQSNSWTGTAPVCVECQTIASTGLNTTYAVEGTTTKVTYSCDVGYSIDGTLTSTCQQTGSWAPAAPSCALCESVVSPSSGSSALSTDGYVSTLTFSCASGYTLVGQTSVTCNTTGLWNGTNPVCECVDPSPPTNGTSSRIGTIATYTCNVGYILIGSATRTCLADGTGWSNTDPTCATCQTLTSPTGGYYNLSTDGLISAATYSCLPGYTISGIRVSYCQSDGFWNSSSPTCVKCADVTNPSSGNVTTTTDGATSTATYACASGYVISVATVRTCTSSGSWTSSAPSCSCSPVSVPSNGTVTSDDGSTAYYTCNSGYTLVGSSVRTCSSSGGGWSFQDPTCVFCTTLNTMTGGNITLATNGTTTRATATCHVGYTINGKTLLTCQTNGVWDDTQPSCAICSTLTTPTGGNHLLHSDGNTVTKATFTCDAGYTLNGSSSLTCDELGNWDLATPTCAKCSDRQAPSSGFMNITTDGQTTSATYSCSTGYNLIGENTVTCSTDGNWNYPDPSCDCDTPGAPTNGAVAADGETVVYNCSTGFTMSGDNSGTCQTDGSGWNIQTPECVQCVTAAAIANGTVTLVSDGVTTQAVYNCSLGSSLKGSTAVSCNTSGSWQHEQPECVSCPSITDVSSGSVTMSTDGVNTTATYTCASGYHISGSSTLTCQINGTWTSDPAECLCDPPSNSSGGSFVISGDGQTATYSCSVGYTMTGVQSISCATDGTGWTMTQPSCTQCDTLQTIAGGNVTLVTSGTQTTANYTCDAGYTLDGQAEAVCQTNGTWTTTTSKCVGCPAVTTISSGKVVVSSDGHTTIATYTCENGYELVGASVLTCQSIGVWNNDPPTCYCEIPTLPVNGNVSVSTDRSTITYSCTAGYILTGVVNRTCQSSGLGWSESAPTCSTCSSLVAPSGGSYVLASDGRVTTASFQCILGYTMDGNATITCLQNGSWTGVPPSCVKCPSVNQPNSGVVTSATDGITTSATYTCANGYRLIGDGYLTCSSTGTWSSQEPTCVCDVLSSPSHGSVTISTAFMTATYGCDVGYSIDGVSPRTCGSDGSGWTDSDPTCVTCPNITTLTFGQSTLVSDGTVTSINYSCDEGATLDGTASLECRSDGTWSSVQPTCVTCLPSLTNPSSGTVTLATNGQITSALYTCVSGYQLIGETSRVCQTTGNWSNNEPYCNCLPPPGLPNGGFELTDNNDTVSYTCDIYYTLNGDSQRICQQNGSGWNGSDPSCAHCEVLAAPSGGSIDTSTSGTQTTATFTCELGRSISGEHINYCQTDATWSSSVPTCVACSTPSDPDSGNVTLTTNGTVTVATYACGSAYHVKGGTDVILCTSAGIWDTSLLECVCDDPATLSHGNATHDGSTVNYTCELGYTLDGTPSRACGSGGSGWSDQDPSCSKCVEITPPTNGNVTLNTNGTVTSASFQCEVGNSRNGSAELRCGADGNWDTTAPTCVSCTTLTAPANGNYTYSSDGTVTTVQLECGEGYTVSGTASMVCHSDGTWDTQQQTLNCEKIIATDSSSSSTESFLVAFIVASVLALILGILLAVFVYLYCRQRPSPKDGKYTSESSLSESSLKSGKIKHLDDSNNFHIPSVKLTPSAAPISHHRHVLDLGRVSTSPAPHSFDRHVTDDSPRSITSLSHNDTSMNSSSLESLKTVQRFPPIGPKHNQLKPISKDKQHIAKLPTPVLPKKKHLFTESDGGRVSPFSSRPSTPVKHAMVLTDVDNNWDAVSDVSGM